MVYLSKIYTRQGDDGKTRLATGEEVPKDSLRIEAYGTVDELLSILGLARSALALEDADTPEVKGLLDPLLGRLQNELFDLGSELATAADNPRKMEPTIGARAVEHLERTMDDLNTELEPLKSFVLPGGGSVAAALHQARTVARRAERRTVSLARKETVRRELLVYLNRLSDLLFVLSRWATLKLGYREELWEPAHLCPKVSREDNRG